MDQHGSRGCCLGGSRRCPASPGCLESGVLPPAPAPAVPWLPPFLVCASPCKEEAPRTGCASMGLAGPEGFVLCSSSCYVVLCVCHLRSGLQGSHQGDVAAVFVPVCVTPVFLLYTPESECGVAIPQPLQAGVTLRSSCCEPLPTVKGWRQEAAERRVGLGEAGPAQSSSLEQVGLLFCLTAAAAPPRPHRHHPRPCLGTCEGVLDAVAGSWPWLVPSPDS